jgi:hypothetical protein
VVRSGQPVNSRNHWDGTFSKPLAVQPLCDSLPDITAQTRKHVQLARQCPFLIRNFITTADRQSARMASDFSVDHEREIELRGSTNDANERQCS